MRDRRPGHAWVLSDKPLTYRMLKDEGLADPPARVLLAERHRGRRWRSLKR